MCTLLCLKISPLTLTHGVQTVRSTAHVQAEVFTVSLRISLCKSDFLEPVATSNYNPEDS